VPMLVAGPEQNNSSFVASCNSGISRTRGTSTKGRRMQMMKLDADTTKPTVHSRRGRRNFCEETIGAVVVPKCAERTAAESADEQQCDGIVRDASSGMFVPRCINA
jgi:hypothetical protein